MSNINPPNPTSRRGPPSKPYSHLRQVSNGSSDTRSLSRPASSTGTAVHDAGPATVHVERRGVIRLHDEAFSKEEVLLDLECFPGINEGDLLTIIPSKAATSVRDFQDVSPMARKDLKPPQMERHNSDPRQVEGNGQGLTGKRYLFIAKNMSRELKDKRPNMEISISKQISDAFGLKHRSNVILATVGVLRCSA